MHAHNDGGADSDRHILERLILDAHMEPRWASGSVGLTELHATCGAGQEPSDRSAQACIPASDGLWEKSQTSFFEHAEARDWTPVAARGQDRESLDSTYPPPPWLFRVAGCSCSVCRARIPRNDGLEPDLALETLARTQCCTTFAAKRPTACWCSDLAPTTWGSDGRACSLRGDLGVKGSVLELAS